MSLRKAMRNARKHLNYGLNYERDDERKIETPRKEEDSKPGVSDAAQESRAPQG